MAFPAILGAIGSIGTQAGAKGGAIAGAGLDLFTANQYGRGFNASSQIPMDKRTKALNKKLRSQADSDYKLAMQGGYTTNLAAPIISGLKAAAQEQRASQMAGIMGKGALYSNQSDMMPGSSLAQMAMMSANNTTQNALRPTEVRNDMIANNYMNAMKTGKGIYDFERQQAVLDYQAQMSKFMNNTTRKTMQGAALGNFIGTTGNFFSGGK